ncbi:hypothetical protein Trichorick_00308 [Candidatus Trichorickettsia mobilis]|uniref:Uncharacterized protein n=1 Tax=Candidatus Trichorickettsia mobilis TaxID=1346319 RepID=A0ABZ0UWJ5_9RICK|nr:hypothetical protein [Candidatus Trichorickettsia mobilis]WPY00434.1 hypothetical protein Trichorick_00308 [Candidatus Trichorickettsia mobilis]
MSKDDSDNKVNELSNDQYKRRSSFSREKTSFSSFVEETKEPEAAKPKSLWQRFKSGVSNIWNKVKSAIIDPITNSKPFNAVTNSTIFKVVTGSAVSRAVVIGLAVAGVVAAAPVAVPFAVAGLAAAGISVGVGVVKDTLQTRSTRKLDKEHQLLVQNSNNFATQEARFAIDPQLKTILANELYTPTKTGKKSVTERYVEGKEASSGFKSAVKVIGERAGPIAVNIVANVTNPVKLAETVIKTSITAGLGVSGQQAIDQKRFELKQGIDTERGKPGAPGYNNIAELKQAKLKQQTQTMAIKQLIADKNYLEMSDQQKLDKFKEIKGQIEQKVEKVQKAKPGFFARMFRDIKRAHNPFDKYAPKNVAKISLTELAPLTKAWDKAQKVNTPINMADLEDKNTAIKEQVNKAYELNQKELQGIETIAKKISANLFGDDAKSSGSRESDTKLIDSSLKDIIYQIKVENKGKDIAEVMTEKNAQQIIGTLEQKLTKLYCDHGISNVANNISDKQLDYDKISNATFKASVNKIVGDTVRPILVLGQNLETIKPMSRNQNSEINETDLSRKRSASVAPRSRRSI